MDSKKILGWITLWLLVCSSAGGKTVIFWQPGFPTVESQPVMRALLTRALAGMNPVFAGIESLNDPTTLREADLLVMP
jgi:hypothetical protein